MRGVGVLDAVTGTLPEWLVPVWAAVTVVGDPGLVAVGSVLAYWGGEQFGMFTRRNGVRLFAVTVTAGAVVTGAKLWFGLPRPPSPSVGYVASGFGFPSGHAAVGSAVFLAGAALSTVSSRRRRWSVGVGVVAVICFSRIALGVHYLVDVLAGVLIGGGVVVLVVVVTRHRVWPGFVVVAVAGVGAGVIGLVDPTGPVGSDALIACGGTVGAAVVWAAITATDTGLTDPTPPAMGAGAVVGGVPLAWVVATGPGPVVTVGAAVLAGGVGVGVPAVRTFRDTGRVPTR